MDNNFAESTAPLLPAETEASPASPLEINDGTSRPRTLPTISIILTPIVILIPLLFLLAFFLPHSNHRQQEQGPPRGAGPRGHHEPAASTVLQFVTERGALVDPRSNQLYGQLQSGVFHAPTSNRANNNKGESSLTESGEPSVGLPCFHLEVSHESVEFGQELQISWHHDYDVNNQANIEDHDIIIALSCGDNDLQAAMIAENLVDAATLIQVKATHARHNRVKSNDFEANLNNKWNIPSFPTIYANQCMFTMLKHMHQPSYRRQPFTKEVHYKILAQKPISLSSSQELPTQIHLGLSSDPHARYIQFTTGLPGGSVVEIAKRPTKDPEAELTFVKLTGGSTSYNAQDMCQTPANTVDAGVGFSNPGNLHTVKAEGLEDDSVYGEIASTYLLLYFIIYSNEQNTYSHPIASILLQSIG